jgi:hypothetical protein
VSELQVLIGAYRLETIFLANAEMCTRFNTAGLQFVAIYEHDMSTLLPIVAVEKQCYGIYLGSVVTQHDDRNMEEDNDLWYYVCLFLLFIVTVSVKCKAQSAECRRVE